jgi:Tol biopolymer transport system component
MRLADRHKIGRAAWAIAAFGVVLAAVPDSGSGRSGRSAKGKPVGYVTSIVSSDVILGKSRHLHPGDQPPLYAGDTLRTDAHGLVRFTVRSGKSHIDCFTRFGGGHPGSVKVQPKPDVTINFLGGGNYCKTPAPGNDSGKWTLEARGAKLMFSDPVFEVVATKRRSTLKVRRGAIVLDGKTGARQAVVLGRNQQSAVASGKVPSEPTGIKQLTPSERGLLGKLESTLPPVRDKEPPETTIALHPRDPSSTRTPTFTFVADEPNVTFACSVDGSDFRLCTSPWRLAGLAPGSHRFAVKGVDPTGNVGRPDTLRWTVDSSRIAFTSERDGNREIYVMDPDGRGQARLTTEPALDADPQWSPDGKRIAFHSERDGNPEIYVMGSDGSHQTDLTNNLSIDRNPTWSPDGTKIAFESYRDGNGEIYVMNADGTNPLRLTFDPAVDFDPAWSPDGTQIAFASSRQGNYEIYAMKPDGSAVVRLTDDPAIEFNPAWSPDGKQIAFHSDQDRESSQIYVMNRDGTDVRRITFTRATDYNPVWAPDGNELAFQTNRDGNDEIYIVDVTTGDLLRLTAVPQADLVPDW